MKLDELKEKEIIILGLGKEGKSTFSFLRKAFPDKQLGLADQLTLDELNPEIKRLIKKDKNLNLHLGQNHLKAIKNYQVVFKSPGIPPFLPEIQKAKRKGIQIESETRLFFDLCPGKIIGVTGTKGKGTTSTLIYQVLKAGGKKAFLVGNIGTTRLKLLPKLGQDSWIVYELSSHQLFNLRKSPHIAVLLNIFPEHLDYYQSFDQYIQAKENITHYQTSKDFLIFNQENELVKKIATQTKAQAIPFSLKSELSSGCFVQKETIVFKDKKGLEEIISTKELPLPGRFNIQNVIPAIIIAKLLNLSNQQIKKGIKSFRPLKHRLEKVGTFKGITFYNDSLATIPQATIEAIKSFEGKVETIILGGFERHQDFKELAKAIWENKIENIVLFPTTGKRIWKEIKNVQPKNQSLPNRLFTENTKKAVEFGYKNTSKGKFCLLSPASPSFSVFKNYQERGNLFKKWVRKLAKDAD